MKKLLKLLAGLAGVVVIAAGALYATAWWKSEQAMARTYVVADPPLSIPSDVDSLARGEHLFASRGCAECHGAAGEGRVVHDAPPMNIVAPNISPAALVARGYDKDSLAAAIRHGVRPDGTPLQFMPSGDFVDLGDIDTAALVAYMQTLPDSRNDALPANQVRPLGRVLYLFGKFPLTPAETIDHTPRARVAPPETVSVDYGRYVAQLCTGCHGSNFAGGIEFGPGIPPSADLRRRGALSGWSEADFARVLREGVRPDGRVLHPMMPIATTSRFSDTEVAAMWMFLDTVAPGS